MYNVTEFNNTDLGQSPAPSDCHRVCLSLEYLLERQHPLFITLCDQKQEYAHSHSHACAETIPGSGPRHPKTEAAH